MPVVLKNSFCPDADTLPRPEAGDVWVMRNILHDWSDADCQRILSAIRAAVGATPITLALVEVCTTHSACSLAACLMALRGAWRLSVHGSAACTCVESAATTGAERQDACLGQAEQILRVLPACHSSAVRTSLHDTTLLPPPKSRIATVRWLSPHIACQLPSYYPSVVATPRSALLCAFVTLSAILTCRSAS